ncbi:hypothetical protein HDV00_007030 [Rhizophlyctis rosea]|nr:hypothetical protein HDV00_007030 [Rhizophlyctis rosea]
MSSSAPPAADTNVFEPAQTEPLTKEDFNALQQAREKAHLEASGAEHETVVPHEHDAAAAAAVAARQAGTAEEGQVTRVVVIAVDNSKNSDTAVQWAVNNFLNPETDLALIINVRPPVIVPGAFGLAYMDATEYIIKADNETSTSVLQYLKARKESHDLLRYYIKVVHKHKPKVLVRGIAMRGDARDEICRKIQEVDADALIMGSRGQGAFRRMVLGSVSDYCLHHATCPIIIIKDTSDTTKQKTGDKATETHTEKEATQPAKQETTPPAVETPESSAPAPAKSAEAPAPAPAKSAEK